MGQIFPPRKKNHPQNTWVVKFEFYLKIGSPWYEYGETCHTLQQTCLPVRICPVLVRKSASSTDVRPHFSKYGHRVSRKCRNRDVNRCEFVATEADCRALSGSFRSLTFADFKSFTGLKYTAGPDWSKQCVKPVNIDFASKLYGC